MAVPAAVRARVIARAGGACEYCRSQVAFSTSPFAVDHIEPRSRAGGDHPDNLAFACIGCNGHKYTHVARVDPASGARVPLFNPRQQCWQEHFVWSDDCCIVLGVTPTGRATVEAMHLNREGVVNLRRALHTLGFHPPPEA